MPELPEVETIVRDIRPGLVGRRIVRVTLSHDDVLRGTSRRRLLRRLTGATIRRVFRRAKHAVLELRPDCPVRLDLAIQRGHNRDSSCWHSHFL